MKNQSCFYAILLLSKISFPDWFRRERGRVYGRSLRHWGGPDNSFMVHKATIRWLPYAFIICPAAGAVFHIMILQIGCRTTPPSLNVV